jgi:hypothetical protein
MRSEDYKRFQDLSFGDFKNLAQDSNLSKYEKIGFPDDYRQGKEELIFQDILVKLSRLQDSGKVVLDIGPGCSDLPVLLLNWCEQYNHHLIWVDSAEMLAQLPDKPCIEKIAAYYPDCTDLFEAYVGKVDIVIAYSLLHYIFQEGNVWQFLDASLSLLNAGGQMLIGDIPNNSKRKRFFASAAGIEFHRAFMKTTDSPEVCFNTLESGKIDDAVVLGLVNRARNQGFDAYLLPQAKSLPMANRREDILVCRP